jgi:hypothetical protein
MKTFNRRRGRGFCFSNNPSKRDEPEKVTTSQVDSEAIDADKYFHNPEVYLPCDGLRILFECRVKYEVFCIFAVCE